MCDFWLVVWSDGLWCGLGGCGVVWWLVVWFGSLLCGLLAAVMV